MARQTVNDALLFLKELMADPAQDTWSAGYSSVLPVFNAAEDLLDAYLASYEIETFRLEATITNITAGTATLPRSGGTFNLPDGLILPRKLWERAAGQTESDWTEMEEREKLPYTAQRQDTFGQWSWEADKINLLPASGSRDLRIEYDGYPSAFTSTSDPLPVEGSAICLAYYAASIVARSRDQHAIADRYEAKGDKLALNIARVQNFDEQQYPTVRRPYRPATFIRSIPVKTG